MKRIYDLDRKKYYWFLDITWGRSYIHAKHSGGWAKVRVNVGNTQMVMFFDYYNEFPFHP